MSGRAVEPAEENGGGERLAEPAEGQRAEGDAELDGGKKVVQILLQAADGAGSGDAGGEHLLDAGVADGDQRELGGHKEGVGQNEHGHGDKLQQRRDRASRCEDSIWTDRDFRDQGLGRVREQGTGIRVGLAYRES